MTAAVLPATAALAVLAAAWHRRPIPPRVLGVRKPVQRPSVHPERRRLVVVALAAVLTGSVTALVLPVLAPVAAGAVVLTPVARDRRARRRVADDRVAGLPEVVDLLAVAVAGGLTVPVAVAAVAGRATGPAADALRRVDAEVRAGRRCADALDDLPGVLGEPVRPLVAALTASERYGAPVAASLDRVAAGLRADHRRRAEEAARKLPVQLLFPLVLCVLPAFALLTVAPLLAGALGSLRL